MENENADALTGKKIFFLNPSAIIKNEIAYELIHQEYEVYYAADPVKLRRVLKKYGDSVVLINIDEGLPIKDWDIWIRTVLGDPATTEISIGVVSAVHNPAMEQKYVSSMELPCGFTFINKSDILKSIKQIYAILQKVDARGRRKYLRAASENESLTTINIPHNGRFLNGVIKDISAAGFSCAFKEDPDLEKNYLCHDIQIKLQSVILKTEAIVFGARMDGLAKIYVFLFTQRIDPDVRIKIRMYIQSIMQAKMDILLLQ
ncbi:hypothetical protein AGMMS50267_03370 [Spirochaetia bacterium]|nr:hypothetical protein AGMMS50267_03370 [Spirochaetia bacterium]